MIPPVLIATIAMFVVIVQIKNERGQEGDKLKQEHEIEYLNKCGTNLQTSHFEMSHAL